MKDNNSFAGESLLLWCGRISSVVITNILWVLLCLPVFTAGAATKAMYGNLYRLLEGESCTAGTFFREFADDFGRTTVLWLVILIAGAALALDYYIVAYLDFPGRMIVIGLIFLVVFLLVFLSGLLFPMLSQFRMGIKDAAVNAVLLSIANLPKSFLVSAMNLLPWALLLVSTKFFVMTGMFWLLGGFALIGLYNAKLLDGIFSRFRSDS